MSHCRLGWQFVINNCSPFKKCEIWMKLLIKVYVTNSFEQGFLHFLQLTQTVRDWFINMLRFLQSFFVYSCQNYENKWSKLWVIIAVVCCNHWSNEYMNIWMNVSIMSCVMTLRSFCICYYLCWCSLFVCELTVLSKVLRGCAVNTNCARLIY